MCPPVDRAGHADAADQIREQTAEEALEADRRGVRKAKGRK